MKIVLLLVTLVITTTVTNAQSMDPDYKTAIGFKIYPGALSIKHFIKNDVAIEGLGYFWNYGSRITGLYEFHGNVDGVRGLKWYAGSGAHIGFWNDKWKKAYPGRQSGIAIGVDGVVGLDYKFTGAPISISVDWQPSFNIIGYNYFEGGWGGIGFRYTF